MADEQFNMLNGSEERAWNPITLWFRRISYICGFIFFVNLFCDPFGRPIVKSGILLFNFMS